MKSKNLIAKNIKMHKEAVDSLKEVNTDIPSDVLGSYTGTPMSRFADPDERPIQDADDL